MADPQTWRELLGVLIENAQERQRIANLSGINAVTLTRWVNNEGNPRPRTLQLLLTALPEHAGQLTELLQREYISLPEYTSLKEAEITKIPSSFYTSVLQSYTKNTPSLRFWSIGKLILQQILQHLDPYRLGLMLTIVGCTTPAHPTQKVRSLRMLLGQGSGTWQGSWDRFPLLLGLESLCGYALSNRHTINIQDALDTENRYYPMVPLAMARSIFVNPIQRADTVAGCLYICSTQVAYFSQLRQDLIQSYAELLTLAFTSAEFYPASRVELGLMPTQQEQEPYFSSFQQRLLDAMRAALQRGESLNSQQATQQVLTELEEELLQLAYSKERPASASM